MEVLSIGAVAKLTGIPVFTLRAWEKRYAISQPTRTDTGRRIYSIRDVERLKLLRELVAQGYSIRDTAPLDSAKLKALLHIRSANDQNGEIVERLLQSIQDVDIVSFNSLIRSSQLNRDTRSFIVQVIAPFLRELGIRVGDGSLDVFQEHAASAILRNVLTGVLYSTELAFPSSTQEPIIFATPEGDYHEFGILIAAILAALKGVRVFYLGPNVPADSLERAALAVSSRIVVVACSSPRHALPTAQLKDYFTRVAKGLPTTVNLWIAGERNAEVQNLAALAKRPHLVLKKFEEFERQLFS